MPVAFITQRIIRKRKEELINTECRCQMKINHRIGATCYHLRRNIRPRSRDLSVLPDRIRIRINTNTNTNININIIIIIIRIKCSISISINTIINSSSSSNNNNSNNSTNIKPPLAPT